MNRYNNEYANMQIYARNTLGVGWGGVLKDWYELCWKGRGHVRKTT